MTIVAEPPCLRKGWILRTVQCGQQNSGYSVNGTFAQYALGQADYLGRIPNNLCCIDAAPILCAGVTTDKGLKMTEAKAGEWVVVSGAGCLGQIAIQYAKTMGFHVVAVDLGPKKIALARNIGAEITIDAKAQDPAKEIQKQIWRRAGSPCHSRFARRVRASRRHASPRRHLRADWHASGRFSCFHL